MAPLRLKPSLLALLATGLLMTGCMDGNDPSATPASTGTPSSDIDTGSYLFGSVNVATAGVFTGQKIVLVDPADGSKLKSIDVDTRSSQMAARAFTVAADGLSTQAGDYTKLYYTHGGKLFELGLSKPASPGNGTQVSSEAHVCRIDRVLPKDGTAQVSWLLLTTAGPDGQCDASDSASDGVDPSLDNETKLVASNTNASTAALTLSVNARQLLDVQRDAQGQLTQLLGYTTTTAETSDGDASSTSTTSVQLVSISAADGSVSDVVNGSIQKVPLFDLNGDPVPNDAGAILTYLPTVSYLGKVAGRTDQLYLRVGQQVGVLTWSGSGASLALTRDQDVTKLATTDTAFAHTDASATYVVDYQLASGDGGDVLQAIVKKLTGSTSSTLMNGDAPSTLPAGLVVQAGSVMTSSGLLLIARQDDHFSLYFVSKVDGQVHAINWPADKAPKVEAVQGDVVVLSQQASVASSTDVGLMRFDAATLALSAISAATHAQVLTVANDGSHTLAGEHRDTHVLWCDASTACNASQVRSYDIASGTNLTVSTATSSATWASTHTLQAGGSEGLLSAASLLSASDPSKWATDGLWLYAVTAAGSLRSVTP